MKKIIPLVLVLVIAIMAFTGCTQQQVIVNMNDYLRIEVSGYNGDGVAEIKGFGAMKKDIMENIKSDYNADLAAAIESGLNPTFNKKSGISNGDEIIVTFLPDPEIAEQFNIVLNAPEIKLSVDGLEERQYGKFNPFEKEIIKFSGNSPYIYIDSMKETDEQYGGNYFIDGDNKNKKYFTIDDMIEVGYNYDREKAEEESLIVEKASQRYDLQSRDSWILKWEDINEDQRKDLIMKALQMTFEMSSKERTVSPIGCSVEHLFNTKTDQDVEFAGYYFFTPKEFDPKDPESIANKIILVCRADMTLIPQPEWDQYEQGMIPKIVPAFYTIEINNLTMNNQKQIEVTEDMMTFMGVYYGTSNTQQMDFHKNVVEKHLDKFDCVENVVLDNGKKETEDRGKQSE